MSKFIIPNLDSLAIDGYSIDLSSGAIVGDTLQYDGYNFISNALIDNYISNIADFRALDAPTNPVAYAVLAGFYSAGDGGGGIFYWNALSVEADNTGTIIKPTAVSGAGRWKRFVVGNTLNVLWFGAIPNGSDDLGARVNAANAVLGNSTGEIIVPDGYYAINTSIRLDSNRTLRLGKGTFLSHVLDDITIVFGQGWDGNNTHAPNIASNISVIGSGWDTILVESDQITNGVSFGYRSISVDERNDTGLTPDYGNYLIKDLKIQGVLTNPNNQTLSTVNVNNANKARIENIWMKDTSALGVQIGGSALSSGMHANNIWVTDCLFENVTAQPISAVNCQNTHINRNSFKAGPRWTVGTMIDFELNSSVDKAENFEVSDNIIDVRGTTTPPGAVWGIAVLGQDPTLEGNLVGPGIISNNTMLGIQYPPEVITYTQEMANPINLAYTRDILVTGNNVRFSAAVYIQYSLRTSLTGNRFQDCAGVNITQSLQTNVTNNFFANTSNFTVTAPIAEVGASDFSYVAYNIFTPPDGSTLGTFSSSSVTLTGAHSRKFGNFFGGFTNGFFGEQTAPGALDFDGAAMNLSGIQRGDSLMYDGQRLLPADRRTSNNTATLFNLADAPVSFDTFSGGTDEVGVQFSTTQPGYITAVRFYKHPSDLSTSHNWTLWGWGVATILAQGTFGTETAFGWQSKTLATPIPLVVNSAYTLSYSTNEGYGAGYTSGVFSSGRTSTPLVVGVNQGRQSGAAAGNGPGNTTDKNYFVDLTFQAGEVKSSNVSEVLLTSTSPTIIITTTNPQVGNYLVSVYHRIITAPTDLTVTASWTDAGGNQTNTFISVLAQSIGSYSSAPLLINVGAGTGSISITATAGTANQVYISGIITLL